VTLTASGLEAAERCPSSFALPRVPESTEAAEDGTRLHEVLAARVAYLRGETLRGPDTVTPGEMDWSDIVLERHPWLTSHVSEVAYAYNTLPARGRLLGRNLGRAYDVGPTEIAGTADYVRVDDEAGVVEVADLKTGRADVTAPSENLQLALLALAAASWHGVTTVRVGILAAPVGSTPWVTWHELGPLDLLHAAARIRRVVEAVEAAKTTPRYSVGGWCGHCPARRAGPTQTAMLRRLALDPQAVAEDIATGIVTPDVARIAYQRYRAVKAAMAQVEAQLHAWAKENGGIPLGNGRVWGPRESQRAVIDVEVAWPELVRRYGVDAAREMMTMRTSKTAIGRVASKLAPRGQKADAAKTALALLTAAGAVTMKTVTEFEEYQVTSATAALPAAASAPPSGAAPVFSEDEGNEDEETT
jgi:hypothetical protein